MSSELQNIQRQLQALQRRVDAVEKANTRKDAIIRDLQNKILRLIKLQRISSSEASERRN